jgi:hypothetical protein
VLLELKKQNVWEGRDITALIIPLTDQSVTKDFHLLSGLKETFGCLEVSQRRTGEKRCHYVLRVEKAEFCGTGIQKLLSRPSKFLDKGYVVKLLKVHVKSFLLDF